MQTMSEGRGARGLEAHGIHNQNAVYWNLSTPALYEEAIKRREGRLAHLGPLVVRTGQHTGRAPNDKFVVQEPSTAESPEGPCAALAAVLPDVVANVSGIAHALAVHAAG